MVKINMMNPRNISTFSNPLWKACWNETNDILNFYATWIYRLFKFVSIYNSVNNHQSFCDYLTLAEAFATEKTDFLFLIIQLNNLEVRRSDTTDIVPDKSPGSEGRKVVCGRDFQL